MINLFIALLAGIGMTWFWIWADVIGGWWAGVPLGLVFFIAIYVFLSRRLAKKLEPLFSQVQKQAQAGQITQAIESLQKLLEYRHWQILLDGQVKAQIGMLYVGEGKEDRAVEFLESSSPRIPEARAFLASIYYRRDETDKALATLEIARKFNKKSPFIFNLYAWMLNKEGQSREAIRILQESLKRAPGNEVTQSNLSRLQNDQRMNMKDFGMSWYSLKLERPPASMGVVQPGRKGFRQPPKERKSREGKRRRR